MTTSSWVKSMIFQVYENCSLCFTGYKFEDPFIGDGLQGYYFSHIHVTNTHEGSANETI